MISTVDPDARHTRKSPEARRDGCRTHVAADPGTGIITDEKLARAAGQENSGPAVAAEFVPPRRVQVTLALVAAARVIPPPARAQMMREARTASPSVTAMVTSFPGMAIRPTAPGSCVRRSAAPGTGQ